MARARNIKPAFFQNEDLAELQPIERLAFIAMWTVADYKGCIEYRAKRLKVQLLPYDNCDIEVIVTNLEKSRFITTYSVQDKTYIKIVNFEKHQNPHPNERKAGSLIPDIGETESKINELKSIVTNHEQDGTNRADSLIPLTDSLNPITHTLKPTLAASVCLSVKQFGILDVNPSNPLLLKLLEAGATVEEFANAAEQSQVKKFAYVIGIVKGQREQALSTDVAKGSVKPKENLAWRNDDNQIFKKAKELGIATTGKSRFELLAKIDERNGK